MASKRTSAPKVAAEARPKKRLPADPEPRARQAARAQGGDPAPPAGNGDENVELLLSGAIRVILTWNLTEGAFRADDDSRRKYPLLRGSGEFAKFVRNLGQRFKDSRFFELDADNNKIELSDSYRAGLISQYAAEYELNATFRVKEDTEARLFLTDGEGGPFASDATRPRELLDEASIDALIAAWKDWPIKRFRISRYGFLQVILETKPADPDETEGRFSSPPKFLAPIKSLHCLMTLADGPAPPDRSQGNDWPGRPELGITAQWEIVGRILSRMIEAIESADTRDDLLRFDPRYQSGWREKQAFVAGTSLPLRTEYIVLSIGEIFRGTKAIKPEEFTGTDRKRIARLLEEVPWMEDRTAPQSSRPSRKTIWRILSTDDATWDGEMCLLSFGTAVITTLHPKGINLPRGLKYESYWRIVGRVVEYFAELRQLARLVERQSADLFEYMLRDLATTGRLQGFDKFVSSTAGLSGLANRLRVASSPDTIAQNDAILAKLQRLRAIFEIGRSLENTDRNLSAVQKLITSAESQQNEHGILLLTAGLAGFTAVLMGLALPPFFFYSHKLMHRGPLPGILGRIPLDLVVLLWGALSIALTVLALLTATRYVSKVFRIGKRIRAFGKSFGF